MNLIQFSLFSCLISQIFCLYHEYYMDPDYLSHLDDLLSSCYESPALYSSQECSRAFYIKRIQNELKEEGNLSDKLTPYIKKEIESIDMTYSSLFENYMMKKRLFKGKISSPTPSINVSNCLYDGLHHEAYDISLTKCQKQDYIDLEFPSAAFNAYNIRLPSRPRDDLLETLLVDLSSHWPTFVQVTNITEEETGHICPYNMHMILWGIDQSLSLRIVERNHLRQGMTRPGSTILHYLEYPLSYSSINISWISHYQTTLSSGEYLFIPSSHLTTFEFPEEGDRRHLMKYCFFDASNLHSVISSLLTESYISTYSKSILKLLSSPALFDFSITRDPPKSMQYPMFTQWPKTDVGLPSEQGEETQEAKGNSLKTNRRNRGKNDFRAWQDTARWNQMISSLIIPQTSIPKLVEIQRRNITISWEPVYYPLKTDKTLYGINITICPSNVVALARSDGKLSERSSLSDQDVNLCQVIVKQKESLIEIVDPSGIQPLFVQTSVQNLSPTTSYQLRITTFYGESGGVPSLFTPVFTTLPDTSPTSPLPPFSVYPSNTSSTSAYVNFLKPIDDGGRPILGYHIFTRHTDRNHHRHWVWNGIYDSTKHDSSGVVIEIKHLLPQTYYQFGISSFNEVGNSSFVSIPTIIRTSNQGKGELNGHNHESRFQSSTFLKALKLNPNAFYSQPLPRSHVESDHSLVTINDEDQVLSIFDSTSQKMIQFEIWDCHWSPRLFLVKGQVVWSVPPLGDRSIQSSIHFRHEDHQVSDPSHMAGKIAIVKRGIVPIVTKALNIQRAGAIACLVLDNGQCEEFNQSCVPGSDKLRGDRFAVMDDPEEWALIKIPVLLMKEKHVDRFLTIAKLPSYDEVLQVADRESKHSVEQTKSEL